MNQVAVIVDAGYFWVQVGRIVHGDRRVRRDEVCIDYAALRQEVLDQAAAQFPNASLLRVYWYDGPGTNGGKTALHHAIDELDDFKLRLGTRNGYGDQKAVDGLIIADLIGLAQSKSIVGAILLSGDADLTPGVTTAQGLGIRVHLLSLGDSGSTSPFLRAEVDFKAHWADATVQKFASASVSAISQPPVPVSAPVAPATSGAPLSSCAPAVDAFADIAQRALTALGHPVRAISLENGAIPRAADGKLLWVGREHFGRDLSDPEKRSLRRAFKALLSA